VVAGREAQDRERLQPALGRVVLAEELGRAAGRSSDRHVGVVARLAKTESPIAILGDEDLVAHVLRDPDAAVITLAAGAASPDTRRGHLEVASAITAVLGAIDAELTRIARAVTAERADAAILFTGRAVLRLLAEVVSAARGRTLTQLALVGDAIGLAILAGARRDVTLVGDAVLVAVRLALIWNPVVIAVVVVELALIGDLIQLAVLARRPGDVAVVRNAVLVAIVVYELALVGNHVRLAILVANGREALNTGLTQRRDVALVGDAVAVAVGTAGGAAQ
jgi:hypothetical protein